MVRCICGHARHLHTRHNGCGAPEDGCLFCGCSFFQRSGTGYLRGPWPVEWPAR